MGSSPTNLDWIVIPLITGSTVLDVGCGYGRWANLLRTNYWEADCPAPPEVDGVDGFAPNIEAAGKLGVYRRVWHQMLPGKLDGNWDTVLACEILEHLPADQIAAMLDSLEAATVRRVIVSTPNGPAYRDGLDGQHGFNELEAHLTHVPRSVLEKRGYRLRGAGFGPPGSRLKRIVDRARLSRDLASLSLHLPALSATYVAYKDMA